MGLKVDNHINVMQDQRAPESIYLTLQPDTFKYYYNIFLYFNLFSLIMDGS